MKYKKTFKSVNYIAACGDTYARWAQGNKNSIDAVQMVVTDETGKEVFYRCVSKGLGSVKTLADCKSVLNNQFRIWKENL